MQFRTNRLLVRDFELTDFASLAPLRADADIARFMDFEPEDAEQARRWFDQAMEYNRGTPRYSHHAVVILQDTGEIGGWISMGYPDNDILAIADRAFGYALAKSFWGRGIMSEAIRGMLQFCFEQERVASVSAQCSKQNIASARCLEKAGMILVREFLSSREKDGASLLYIAHAARG